jgi:peptidoglycan/xylan/chitin deacetylase (PgdA/CDA1 family)
MSSIRVPSRRFIPVLLYHAVGAPSCRADRRFTVSRADFEAHAEVIEASGRASLRISDLAAGLRGERALPLRVVAVTFDDGFADTYDAAHVLLARGLCSTVYITTGMLGAPGRLTRAGVAELARVPSIEVGAHSVRHPHLDELGDRQLGHEVRASREDVEQLTGLTARSFAYPHGAYDSRVRRAVIAAGYGSAAAVKNALSHPADDAFAIARWTVTSGTPASRIAEVLEGEGVPLAWARERSRTRAYRSARRLRRRLAGATRWLRQ